MLILALDTASNAGGVALSRNGEVVGLHMAKTPLKYSERLIEWVDFLLKQHEISMDHVDCFAVAAGPGSFTGLRIGLAAAKAFGQALGRPVIAVSSLEALAFRFRQTSRLVAPVVDARRQQVYAAVYETGAKELRVHVPEDVGRADEWARKLSADDGYSFVGDGALLYRSTLLTLQPHSQVIESDNCVLAELCQLAYLRHSQGKGTSAEAATANYIRPPDVQLQPIGGKKTAGPGQS